MTELRLIAGSGRSGTTWVLDALAEANGLRPVFEPLNPFVSEVGSRYAHRCLVADEFHPDLRDFLEDVLAGRRHRLWTQYRRLGQRLFSMSHGPDAVTGGRNLIFRWQKFLRELPRLARATRRATPIVKCIRANLMLGWIARQFDSRIILVVRHPGAVIESEMRNAWDPTPALERFRTDAKFDQLTNGRYRGLLNRRLNCSQGLALQWVIENQFAVEMAPAAKVAVFCYEGLKVAPEETWEEIRIALGLEHVPDTTVRARPSQQTSPSKVVAQMPHALVPSWRHALTAGQLAEIQGILDEAGCTLYSMDENLPHQGALCRVPPAASRAR